MDLSIVFFNKNTNSQGSIIFKIRKGKKMALENEIAVRNYLKKQKNNNLFPKNNAEMLMCMACGIEIKVDYSLPESSYIELENLSGFQFQNHRMVFYGYCQDCGNK